METIRVYYRPYFEIFLFCIKHGENSCFIYLYAIVDVMKFIQPCRAENPAKDLLHQLYSK